MISSIFSSVRPVLIALLVLLTPAAVPAQEQKQLPVSSLPDGELIKEAVPAPTPPAPDSRSMPDKVSTEESVAQNARTSEQAGRDESYMVKEGDTLWDISNTFLKDPFLWPFIWKANPSIANADLIYPGNTLTIPSLGPVERAMQAPPDEPEEQLAEKSVQEPAEEPREQVAEKSVQEPETSAPFEKINQQLQRATAEPAAKPVEAPRLIIPDAGPMPVMDKYSMLNAGFVSEDEGTDRIVGAKEEKTILGYDDIVYVSVKSKAASPGDKFIIYTPLNKVKHPVTGQNYGRLTKVLGILELTEKGLKNTYVARITRSFDHAGKGNMLAPYQEPVLVYDRKEPKSKDVAGYILEVVDGRTINAQTDIVYLDKGNADGVEPGDRFLVYPGTVSKRHFARHAIGEAQVFLVKEHTATAIVRKSTDTMAKGDIIEYKK